MNLIKSCMVLLLLFVLVVEVFFDLGVVFLFVCLDFLGFVFSKTLACVFRSSTLLVYPWVAIQNLMCPFSY